jgi:hypothetical protein
MAGVQVKLPGASSKLADKGLGPPVLWTIIEDASPKPAE